MTWPLSLPGVVSGTLLTFIPAAGDYINAQLLGSPNQRMVGSVIQSLFTDANNYPTAAALSMILMFLIVAMVLVLRAPGRDGGAAVTWLRKNLVLILGLLVLVYTFIPIFVVILMSFNDPTSRLIYQLRRVHAAQLAEPVRGARHVHGAEDAASRSGSWPPSSSTVLGTLAAFALVRHEFRGRSARTC